MNRSKRIDLRATLIDLASDAPTIQARAEASLLATGAEVAPALASALEDDALGSIAHVRVLRLLMSLRALPAFDFAEALPSIRRSLERARARRDSLVLPAAMETLVAVAGAGAAPDLAPLLADPDRDVVKYAAVLLGNTRSEAARAPLIALFESADPSLRYSAAKGLLALNDEASRGALAEARDRETDPDVRALLATLEAPRGAYDR